MFTSSHDYQVFDFQNISVNYQQPMGELNLNLFQIQNYIEITEEGIYKDHVSFIIKL